LLASFHRRESGLAECITLGDNADGSRAALLIRPSLTESWDGLREHMPTRGCIKAGGLLAANAFENRAFPHAPRRAGVGFQRHLSIQGVEGRFYKGIRNEHEWVQFLFVFISYYKRNTYGSRLPCPESTVSCADRTKPYIPSNPRVDCSPGKPHPLSARMRMIPLSP
jgi:hypothetical protein